ncbi:MAG: OsmC family protein [Saprospiraceae bacterium]|nr:OsmC family protein [Saprospiraceae bacterium]
MEKTHHYKTTILWTGNTGSGTKTYTSYNRNHTVAINNKEPILCSSDPSFRGDITRHNPEELFLASLSSCHMLWYLHLCADNHIIVLDYRDNAIGTMIESAVGGHFTEVVLNPIVTIADGNQQSLANELHKKANQFCFIANSCNFPVHHNPTILVSPSIAD